MWTDVGIAQWIVMGLMLLLMALIVVLVGWLLTAPLWERLRRRRAEIRRSRLRAAKRSARFERKRSSGWAGSKASRDPALEELRSRYARGEVGREEFDRRKRNLA